MNAVTPFDSRYAPGFMVLHGNRLEDLRDVLVDFVQKHPLAPLQAEVILLQSNGMKHWLEMALADDAALGVCAATRLELPAGYLWPLYRQVLGPDAVPLHMPFDKAYLQWRLLRLLPQLAVDDALFAPLARYIGDGSDVRRLYQLAQQLADVLDGYQSYRADWLHDWAAGRDVLRGVDGRALPLDEGQRWQAALWRAVRADVGVAQQDASRSGVHSRFMCTLQQWAMQYGDVADLPVRLPPRIVVFGISSLPMQTVEALAALGQWCQVLMLVQNPCQYYWGDVVDGHSLLRHNLQRRQPLKPDALAATLSAATAGHPLLASWGKQGRDYLHLLDAYDQVQDYRARLQRVDVFVDPAAVDASSPPSQLAQLQSRILHLEPLAGPPTPRAADDDSISLVTAHSAQREVEVLHDALLRWFDAHPDWQPRDVMVMVPDMAQFAPHIHAVFGRFTPGQPRHIPYSVADTTARQSPLVQALEWVLGLPSARVSLVDWHNLFAVDAVRQRFGLDEADVDTAHGWLQAAGVRWGLDGAHRQAWGLSDAVADRAHNTWAFGIRRLLLGYALGEAQTLWGDTAPQPGLSSLDTVLASKLLLWLDAVQHTLRALAAPHTPAQWCALLTEVVQRFFAPCDEAQERLLQRLVAPLDSWLQACTQAGLAAELPLDVVRSHWLTQLDESQVNQRFFGGGVQFGTLMPMRSIPFKVICLLGMNDGDYPRPATPRDFDLMAHSWRPGDRSRREDDRYLFLEALLSARERLYISWQGHRATDNSERPPSVLVAQLIDYLNQAWTPPRVPVAQPLHPYSLAYFVPGTGFSTYDHEWQRLHTEAAVAAAPAIHAGPLSPPPSQVTLAQLHDLLRHPERVFFKHRLQVRLPELTDPLIESESFALQGLDKHQVGEWLLQVSDPQAALQQLAYSGALPLAGFGERVRQRLQAELAVLHERQAPWWADYPEVAEPLPVDWQIEGVAVQGVVQGLRRSPQGAYLLVQQRLGAVGEGSGKSGRSPRGHVLVKQWVSHVLACACGVPVTSVTLGLDAQWVLAPLSAAAAQAIAAQWLQVYQHAWQRPLPVACKTGWAFVQTQRKGDDSKDPHTEAAKVFEGGYQRSGERDDSPTLQRVWSTYADIAPELPHWASLLYGGLADHVAAVVEEAV